MFYKISCPRFPDDGTTVVNDRVHKAATRLVQYLSPAPGTFPGIAVTVAMQKDGSWQHNMRFLTGAARIGEARSSILRRRPKAVIRPAPWFQESVSGGTNRTNPARL